FPEIWYHMTVIERIALFLIMLGEYFVMVQLVKRGNDLVEQLIKTSSSEQDLLVKKTIMEQLSKMDALTELNNHKTFQEYLDHMIEHSDRNKMLLQMAIIDIDNFKSVNDTYGHSVGDVILKKVAKVIQHSITSDDILARYGGEEFAILFPAKTLQQALDVCENIRKSISQLDNPEMENRKV